MTTPHTVHFPTIGVTITREVSAPLPPSDADALRRLAAELVALLDLLVQYPRHAMARTMLRSALGLARSIQVRAVRCDHDL